MQLCDAADSLNVNVIQEDIGGHPPVPLGPPPLFLSNLPVSLIVAQFTIFGSFWVLNFRSRFEALSDVFSTSNGRENKSPFRTQDSIFSIYGCSP